MDVWSRLALGWLESLDCFCFWILIVVTGGGLQWVDRCLITASYKIDFVGSLHLVRDACQGIFKHLSPHCM